MTMGVVAYHYYRVFIKLMLARSKCLDVGTVPTVAGLSTASKIKHRKLIKCAVPISNLGVGTVSAQVPFGTYLW